MSGFSDCFGEIGTLRNTQYIEIEDNVTPEVTPVKKIPLALKSKRFTWMPLSLSKSQTTGLTGL